jgi:hypothetical protein
MILFATDEVGFAFATVEFTEQHWSPSRRVFVIVFRVRHEHEPRTRATIISRSSSSPTM